MTMKQPVSREIHDQVVWERDQAINTLNQYGLGIGEKRDMVEVVRCVHCRKWDEKGAYGIDSDGDDIMYGRCAITKMVCPEKHFCGYGKKREGTE